MKGLVLDAVWEPKADYKVSDWEKRPVRLLPAIVFGDTPNWKYVKRSILKSNPTRFCWKCKPVVCAVLICTSMKQMRMITFSIPV